MNLKYLLLGAILSFALLGAGSSLANQLHDAVRSNKLREAFIVIEMGFIKINEPEEGTAKTALDIADERWASHRDNAAMIDLLEREGAQRTVPLTTEEFWKAVIDRFDLQRHYRESVTPWLN
jgi:hypothetical protein